MRRATILVEREKSQTDFPIFVLDAASDEKLPIITSIPPRLAAVKTIVGPATESENQDGQ